MINIYLINHFSKYPMTSYLRGKSILITGGTGSIGESITKKAIEDKARLIRVFSNDENSLYEMENIYGKNKNVEFVIGDISDEETTSEIVKGIDIVFHAAALKHVDRCELYPIETINVNLIGTKNIVKSAKNENVKKLILISTDKAVNPIGVMGATKLLAEKLLSAESFHNNSKTIFASVRFGNVFQTRGSILPKIEKQIAKGGPITLTDKRMKRFFMTREDAVNLIINATTLAKGGETFVLKMPLLNLEDLFECMKLKLSGKYGLDSSKIKIIKTGIRPGEKITEYLLTHFEMENVLETKNFYIIPSFFEDSVHNYPNSKKIKNASSYFENLQPISKNQILKMLDKVYKII